MAEHDPMEELDDELPSEVTLTPKSSARLDRVAALFGCSREAAAHHAIELAEGVVGHAADGWKVMLVSPDGEREKEVLLRLLGQRRHDGNTKENGGRR